MMKKKQSIIALVLAAIVTVLLGWTMIKGWGPTGTGSMKNINLGLDLSGGVSITYQAVKDNPTDEEMSDTRYKLEQRAQQYSEEAQVYLQGDNRITIEIPGATDATTIWKRWVNREACISSNRPTMTEQKTTPTTARPASTF